MRAIVGTRGRAVVLLATLVVLAGCNGLALGASDSTPSETVTPVPVKTDTPAETPPPRPATFAWLVSANGTVYVDALFSTHTRRLANTSFTLAWTRRTTGGTGPITASFDRRIAVVNDTVYSQRRTGSSVDGVVLTYADRSGLYQRVEAANGSLRNRTATNDASYVRSAYALLGASEVSRMFVPGDARVRYVERDGTRYAQLFSSTPPEYLRAIYTNHRVRNFSITVWVHPDRYIRTVHYEFDLVNGEERITVGERYSYTGVGETTVDQPPWVAALASNGSAAPAPDENESVVTVTTGPETTGNTTSENTTATRDGTTTPTTDGNTTAMPTADGNATPAPTADGGPAEARERQSGAAPSRAPVVVGFS